MMIQLDQKEIFTSYLLIAFLFSHNSFPGKIYQVNDELQVAVRNNDVEAVKAAIEEGADVNVHDEEGWTPLMWAALHQSLDMVPGVKGLGAGEKAAIATLDNVRSLVEFLPQ